MWLSLPTRMSVLLFSACLGLGAMHARALAAAPPTGLSALSLTWPRQFDAQGEVVELYQPDIETWRGDRLAGRAALALGSKGGTPTYGVVHFSAQADVDKSSGLVQLTGIRVDSVEVPARPAAASQLRNALVAHLPATGLTVPLDPLEASYAVSPQAANVERITVSNEAPRIVFATIPTLLVPIDGEPVWKPVSGTHFDRVVNSRALMLRDARGGLYLNGAGYWYASESAGGTWAALRAVPDGLLDAARKAEAAARPDPMLPRDGRKAPTPPTILLATQPTELLVTDGAPRLAPVAGVDLLTVSNTESAMFVDPDNNYYVLVSGRWFRSAMLPGPWEYVPGRELPPAFSRIPPDDPKANVLVSVPGMTAAHDAEIAATIAQTATVSRARTTVTVAYDGAPHFAPITGTPLRYAINTATPVIQLDGDHFHAVVNGVWFEAPAATGPWHVATEVPAAIRAIPASSPLHYVTYVRIYSVMPEAVVVGYTPGYLGVVVSADGTVVYGTGYIHPPYIGNAYYGNPATYGYGAGFALGPAEGFAFGFAAGAVWGAASPYWEPYAGPYGTGTASSWNYLNVDRVDLYGRWPQGTVAHAIGWTVWTGTPWQRGATPAFHPYAGSAAGGRQAASYNAQTGRPDAAAVDVAGKPQPAQAAAAIKSAATTSDKGNAGAWNSGSVYAGGDGNVYQYGPDGWQKNSSNGWEAVPPNSNIVGALDRQRRAHEAGQQRFAQTVGQWKKPQGGFGSRGGSAGHEEGSAGDGATRGDVRH